jgi:CHAT domain-containing protein
MPRSIRPSVKKLRHFLWKFLFPGLLSLCLTLMAIPVLAQSSDPSPNPSTLLEQGRSHYNAGRFADAAKAWQQSAETYANTSDRLNQALSLSYRSLADQELNHWNDAKQAIEQSLAILRDSQADAVLLAQALNTQASLQLHLGQSNAALETWQEAQKYYQQADDRLGELGSQINQAQALQSLGFYRRSKQQLEEINQSLAAMPDSIIKIAALRELGVTLQVIGDLTESRAILFESLAIAERLGATTEKSATLISLGQTARDWGDRPAALTLFEQAEQSAINPSEQLQARLSLLNLYIEEAQGNKLKTLIPQIYQQLTELSISRTSVYAAVNLAANLTPLPPKERVLSPQELSGLLSNAVRSAKDLQDPQAEAYALTQWGQLYAKNKQWAEAYQLTQKSLTLARTLQADDIASQAAWQLGRILKQQGKTQDAIAAYTEAVTSLRSLRSDIATINPDIQFSFRESVEPVYRELVALLLSDHPNSATLNQARELIESLQVAELDNFFREACLDAQPQQIDQVDPQAAIVYPIILPDRLAVIWSIAGQLHYYTTPIAAPEVNRTLRQYLAAIHPAADNTERLRLSQTLYDWLIRPAEADRQLANTQTMVFVLDGLMRSVPIAALHDGKQYLIEKYAVTLSPGLQLITAKTLSQQGDRAVVAGISEARHGFSAIPAVASEVKDIGQRVTSSTLLNQEFTSNALEQRVKNSKAEIVHLATHGQFSSQVENTFLLTWEGRMGVQELASLLKSRENKQAIELLVLSACETASGDERAVLGLAGLAVKSGARSTLATLWSVRDTATALLMNQFYDYLGEPGISKAEALRKAQMALIANPDYDQPFFWSPFVLVGNWL